MMSMHTLAMLATLAAAVAVVQSISDCKCKDRWQSQTCDNGMTQDFHGCPQMHQLSQCKRDDTDFRWCETTEKTCNQQTHLNLGKGRVSYCDYLGNDRKDHVPARLGSWELANWCHLKKIENGKVRTYDLSPLQKGASKDGGSFRESMYKVRLRNQPGNDDQDYFMNVCGPMYDIDKELGMIAAYEENPSNANRTHVLAGVDKANLTSLRDGDLRMEMGGGSACHGVENNKPRSMKIFFMCEDVGLGSPVFADEVNTCEYYFLWASCAACPLGHAYRSNNCGKAGGLFAAMMSPGSTLIIIFMVVVMIYCVGGCFFNRFVQGAKGVDQIPHFEWWISCCDAAASGPGALWSALCGRSKPTTSVSFQMHSGNQGLIDVDDSDADEDAEDRLYE